ncbi:MAG: hypothetical protein AABX66_01830 [Nanoarchaeota archaeon]
MVKEVAGSTNNSGIAGVILGIMSLGTLLSTFVPALVFAIVGLIFSIKQKRVSSNSWSKSGIILNIIAILLSIVFLVISIIFIQKNPSALSQLAQTG